MKINENKSSKINFGPMFLIKICFCIKISHVVKLFLFSI